MTIHLSGVHIRCMQSCCSYLLENRCNCIVCKKHLLKSALTLSTNGVNSPLNNTIEFGTGCNLDDCCL